MKKFLVFDVESNGLNGSPFAIGYVIVDELLNELDFGWCTCNVDEKEAGESLKWLKENIPHEVLYGGGCSQESMLRWFFGVVEANKDAILVCDCGYPVETNMLKLAGIPVYPLHEVATALMLCEKDPIGIFDRLPNELPKHHPLNDARQSARVWISCLDQIQNK